MQQDPWKPDQYKLFERERKQPGLDLIGLVQARPGISIVDLGCGTGDLSRELHERVKAAQTIGIDSSEQMLSQAKSHSREGLSFVKAGIESYAPAQPLDVVFSNAALQWVPGHEELFARMTSWLREGGQLAVQLPAMEHDPLHVTVAEVAGEAPFKAALNGFVQHLEVHEPEWYAKRLYDLGYREQNVFMKVYGHVLPARESAIEWMKGTMLTAYQRRLSPELYAQFVARYREKLLPQLGDRDPYFLPYKRILIWGQR